MIDETYLSLRNELINLPALDDAHNKSSIDRVLFEISHKIDSECITETIFVSADGASGVYRSVGGHILRGKFTSETQALSLKLLRAADDVVSLLKLANAADLDISPARHVAIHVFTGSEVLTIKTPRAGLGGDQGPLGILFDIVQELLFELNNLHPIAEDTEIIDALSRRDWPLCELLLSEGADPNGVNDDGMPLLANAVIIGDIDAARLLLRLGADIDILDEEDDCTLLHLAIAHNDRAMAELLLTNGVRVNQPSKTGVSPLMMAARTGAIDCAAVLLEHDAGLELRDLDGYTALMYASNVPDREMVDLLLSYGAQVNALDNEGASPLLFASQHGDMPTIKALVAAGADVGLISDKGYSAVSLAKHFGHTALAKYLKKIGHPD